MHKEFVPPGSIATAEFNKNVLNPIFKGIECVKERSSRKIGISSSCTITLRQTPWRFSINIKPKKWFQCLTPSRPVNHQI